MSAWIYLVAFLIGFALTALLAHWMAPDNTPYAPLGHIMYGVMGGVAAALVVLLVGGAVVDDARAAACTQAGLQKAVWLDDSYRCVGIDPYDPAGDLLSCKLVEVDWDEWVCE